MSGTDDFSGGGNKTIGSHYHDHLILCKFGTYKVMTALVLVIFLFLVWPEPKEWLPSKCYCGVAIM
jgi:hypothetical protein